MMTVKEYANDTNHTVAEILKKCEELGIKVKSGDSELSEDDIIILDNAINLISTADDTSLEEEDVIDEAVEDIMETANIKKSYQSYSDFCGNGIFSFSFSFSFSFELSF